MKTLALFFTLLLSFPLMLPAQSADDMLKKVSSALDGGQFSQAVSYFRQAIAANVDRSEMFYWTSVDKNSEVSSKMAYELAAAFKRARNYDKGFLFYKELLQKSPNNVDYLAGCAEMEVGRGNEKEALRTYEKVIELDLNNLAANIYIGNYYYLMAEKDKKQLDNDYKKITSPTRMQYARYKDGLNLVLATRYEKAKEYLQKVIQRFPSMEAKKTLEKILLIEKEVNK